MLAFVLAALFTLPPQQSDATIGVTAIHLESGRRISVRGTERFPMASVYKFPIGLAILRRVDTGTLSLSRELTIEPKEFSGGHSPLRDGAHGQAVARTVGQLLELMVSQSDNTASDVLLKLAGGPNGVTARMAELNASHVRVNRTEKEILRDFGRPGGRDQYLADARDTTTPDAMADLLVTFWKKRAGLNAGSHDLLATLMIESPTGERKLRAALPSGWKVAHKSGMMPGTSNDVGILISPDGRNHIAIAIFAKGSKLESMAVVDKDIVAATKAVMEHLLASR